MGSYILMREPCMLKRSLYIDKAQIDNQATTCMVRLP